MFGKGVDATRYLADASRALDRIATLEADLKRATEVFSADILDLRARVGELEAAMKVLKAEVRTEVTQTVADRMQAAQRDFNDQLREVAIGIDRLERGRLPPSDQ